ncbi:MAG: hypothetical protein PV340_03560 [Wolbachia sp.]|nr:hypothetical protein [Wolbachia sp.]MDD9335807.1 hypothetical protein [Wolbachia sp.]
MLGRLKKVITGFILGTKSQFASSSGKSRVYVKDFRRVMISLNGKKCKYPENYDQVVNSAKIVKEGSIYKLVYNGNEFNLSLVNEAGDRSYFTLEFLVNPQKHDVRYPKYYKPFGFSKIDLEKYVPVFEVDLESLKLTNSSVLTKKGFFNNNRKSEINKKGRNGRLLCTSDYQKLNINFFAIRDQNGGMEIKSVLSAPVVFCTGFAKALAKFVTHYPMKLGERLLSNKHWFVRRIGYALFVFSMVIKNLVNVGANLLRAPILLFTLDKKKYADNYLTAWTYQVKESWNQIKDDYEVLRSHKRVELEQEDLPKLKFAGTWDELNAIRSDVEKKLENQKSGTNETLSQTSGHHASEKLSRSREKSGKSTSNETLSQLEGLVKLLQPTKYTTNEGTHKQATEGNAVDRYAQKKQGQHSQRC